MIDMRPRLKDNGITITWLADKMTEKIGKPMRKSHLNEVLSGRVETIGAVVIRQMVDEYLAKVESVNKSYFTKEKV